MDDCIVQVIYVINNFDYIQQKFVKIAQGCFSRHFSQYYCFMLKSVGYYVELKYLNKCN